MPTDTVPATPSPRPDVLVVGAGYAGIHAARTAADAGAHVTVVDPTGRHDLAPRLAAVAAGRRPVGDGWSRVDDLLAVEVARASVQRVDPDGPTVTLDDGRQLRPRAVVVTTGARPWLPTVDGLDPDDATTLKDAGDALRIRSALPAAHRLVVVGGGATGVQLAAEVAGRYELPVHLVEVAPTLLAAFPARLGRRAQRLLERRGVDVRLRTDVTRADRRGVELDDGDRLDGLVVWTTGVAADASTIVPGAALDDGRLVVDRSLRVAGDVFAAGDVAATTDLFGRVTAQSAQIALQSGRTAGRNAAAAARGDTASPTTIVDLGWIVDMGGRGVAQVGPIPLAGPLLDRTVPVLHELVDLRHLLQAGGLGAVLRHAPGRHRPSDAAVRRAERPGLRSVG